MSEFSSYDIYQASGAAVGSQNTEVVRKTQAEENKKNLIPEFLVSSESNVLNQFRTFTYIFTLACVKASALRDPETLRKSSDFYVVAKTSGKGNSAILRPDGLSDEVRRETRMPKTTANQQLVDSFNDRSSGKFDFFINNVEIETLMSGDNKTNMSVATQISFEIFEPYSINGFFEAIQVAAIAAGHASYAKAPFLLKMEFIGNTDNDADMLTDRAIKKLGPEATRYFVFTFTGMDISATENGTRYSCKGVPHNEIAFGDSNKLKTNAKISGVKVGEILRDFMTQINKSKQDESKKARSEGSQPVHDQYNIVFPLLEADQLNYNVENSDIANANLDDLLLTANNYSFAKPDQIQSNTVRYSPTAMSVHFADGQNIHDCIIAIVRDSDYVKNNLKSLIDGTTPMPADGLVDYFSVNIETEPLGIWDEAFKRELYKYTYVVMPYKIHYTRIPAFQNSTVKTAELKKLARREYNYIYTGKNVDVKNFNLKFDTMYFQSIPNGMAKSPIFSAAAGIQNKPETVVQLREEERDSTVKREIPSAEVRSDVRSNTVTPAGGSGSRQNLSDPYDSLVKTLHQSILDNLSMITAELVIHGDPFFLVTGGTGNYRPKLKSYGETQDSEAAYQTGDIFIVVNFINPIDIDTTSGLLRFPDKNVVAPFSGVFRVIKVKNVFKDGVFEQTLNLLRVPGQPIDTNQQPENDPSPFEQKPNPTSIPIPVQTPIPRIASINELQLASLSSPVPNIDNIFSQISEAAVEINNNSEVAQQGIRLSQEKKRSFGGSLSRTSDIATNLRLAAAGLQNTQLATVAAATAVLTSQLPTITDKVDSLISLKNIDENVPVSAASLNRLVKSPLPPSLSLGAKFGIKPTSSPLSSVVNNSDTED
jgi:hypothetical protein